MKEGEEYVCTMKVGAWKVGARIQLVEKALYSAESYWQVAILTKPHGAGFCVAAISEKMLKRNFAVKPRKGNK